MKKAFIKDIREKDQINDRFLVTKKDVGIGKSGKQYLNMKIADATGELEARVWDDAENVSKKFAKDDVVHVKGFAVAYLGGLQVNINEVTKVPEGEFSPDEFLPASKRDRAQMMSELEKIISRLSSAPVKRLLTAIISDPDVKGRLLIAPAAKAMHHPYIGGLLEHILSMCGLATKVAEHYKDKVDKDMLIAGAVLHDIGKIYELSYQRSFDYTDEGKLLGHITLGVELIDSKLRLDKDFPRETAVLLKHMVLSHHGFLEFGSPKRPKTLEAMILYFIDDLDAKVTAINALTANGGGDGGSNWTPWHKMLERAIYKGGAGRGIADEESRVKEKPGEDAEPDLFKKQR